jgi:UDP-N-acetyl-D-glucosamine dehydrogenase
MHSQIIPSAGMPHESSSHAPQSVAVVGLGYVGLPTAVEFARCGLRVTGFDTDAAKVQSVNDARSYISDVADDQLRVLLARGHLRATADMTGLSSHEAVLVTVPTPLNKQRSPDLGCIQAACESIGATLRPGQLVVLESTTYPGTTEEFVSPLLEERSGLTAGQDFGLAFCAERIDPGNTRFPLRRIPRVVGGVTPQCTERAAALYSLVFEHVHRVSSTRSAEMAKLLENTFRNVNIALVNELAQLCQGLGVDVWEVIEAAATKPFGFMPFYPGPGIGGHCIPVDPVYLTWRAKEAGIDSPFIELAAHINAAMPAYVVRLVSDALNARQKPVNGSRILVVGVAYKAGIDDVRESPAEAVMRGLQRLGADVSYHDPFVPELNWDGLSLTSSDLTPDALGAADCVLVLTAHPGVDYVSIAAESGLVVDTRNTVPPGPNTARLGAFTT